MAILSFFISTNPPETKVRKEKNLNVRLPKVNTAGGFILAL